VGRRGKRRNEEKESDEKSLVGVKFYLLMRSILY